MRIHYSRILLIIMMAFFVSCSGAYQQKRAEDMAVDKKDVYQLESEKLNVHFETYFDEFIELNPIYATFIGDDRYDDKLANGLSVEYRTKEVALYNKYAEIVSSIDRNLLEGQDRLSYDIFLEQMENNIEGSQFESHLLPINQFRSRPSFMAQLGSGKSIHPFKTVKNYEDFLGRIESFETWVDTAIFYIREGIKRGIVQPKILIEKTYPQFEAHVVDDAEESIFYTPITNFPEEFSEEDKSRLTESYTDAIRNKIVPSYKKLAEFIKDEYLPNGRTSIGLSDLPNGAKWYAYRVKSITTTSLDPLEIHEIGLNEVKRIRTEIEKVMEQVGFKGTLSEFFESLKTDPQHYYDKEEDLIAGYGTIRDRVDPELTKLFSVLPKADYEIRPVEAFRAKTAAGGSYMAPSPDGSRPGVFYANTYDLSARPKYSMEALFLHEASPGHHFQIAMQFEQKDLPKFRRFGGYTAYTEGWALYAEGLGKELGIYTDPYQYYGRFAAEIFRAIRLVVDTGMHSKGWSREEALDYLYENSGSAETRAVAEIERYLAIPGQALAYKIGQMKILELKEYSKDNLGEKFDIREFHNVVLKDGALPLSVLEIKVKEWVNSQM